MPSSLETIKWQHAMRASTRMPSELSQLMLDVGSMTARLRSLCDNTLDVEVLRHDWHSVTPSEYVQLDIAPPAKVILREVILSGNQQPWMYARVVLPEHVVSAYGDELLHLGERPLGEVLFQDGALARSEFDIASISISNPLVSHLSESLFEDHQLLWVRRSTFHIPAGDILLIEVVLPALLRRIQTA